MWKKLVKYLAQQAFTWGLRKMNEIDPPEPPKKVRSIRSKTTH